MGWPRALRNSSGTEAVPLTANHALSADVVSFHKGRHRSFRPLPWTSMLACPLKGQLVDAQPDEFGDAQSSGKAEIQHGAIPDAVPRGWFRSIEDGLASPQP